MSRGWDLEFSNTIEDYQSMFAVVTEPLSHRGTSEGSNVLERSGLGGGSGDNDGVLHGVVLLEGLDKLGNGGSLLTDGDVDAVKLLLLVGTLVPPLLVEHSVEGNGGLSGLTVTDNQLTLTTSDGNHGIDGLEASLDGLVDGLTGQDTGGLELSTAALGGLEGTLSIDGVTESVYDTSKEGLADGDIDLLLLVWRSSCSQILTYNLSGTLDGLAFLDQTVRTEKHDTDLAGFQVHAHALDTGGEPVVR
jgi:hypothetical protein